MEQVRQLLSACEHGDAQTVQELLDQGVDVDSPDEYETTALQVAAANGHDQLVRLLLMRGAAADKPNFFGWTPLMQASRHGHVNIVALLLQHQVDLNARTRYGNSTLTLAARGGHHQVVRLLVESGIDLDSSGSVCEITPLLVAAQHGNDAVLRLLLDRGCDVNYRTQSTKITPLMVAALNGHMTTAQILIERGGDPNITDVCGKTALEIASVRGKREVTGYLDRKTTNKPIIAPEEVKPDIIEAAKHGDIYRISEILELDVSQRDACNPQDGATPLMFAAMTGRLNIAQLLVEKGCDINKQDTISGWTALMQATYHGKKAVAVFLINVGADVTIQARNGCTAFDMASLIDDVDTDLLRLLADRTLKISKGEKSGKSKHWSKQNGSAVMTINADPMLDEQPKSGLKGWLNRLSNRFRNLKIGRTFNSNRLTPLSHDTTSSDSLIDLTSKPSMQSPKLAPKKTNNFMMDSAMASSSITSYDTMLKETQKSASQYTLNINPPHSPMSKETLKPVIPPLLPQPSFALDGDERSRRTMSTRKGPPSISSDSTVSSQGRPLLRPMKFLQSASNLSSSQISPTSSGRYTNSHPSPNSSGDYQQSDLFVPLASPAYPINAGSLPYSSTRSPIFFPSSTPSRLTMPRKSASSIPSAFRTASNTTSPNSSTSGSSSITPQRSSRSKGTSSKGSTTSTLTPSPSPTPGKFADENGPMLGSVNEHEGGLNDELSGILKKLSLEKYNPIFEEQEVDMEAFLTLTDDDLRELGISSIDSRRQILTAITELNTGKGRERQQFHDTMTTFQTTLKARIPSEAGSEGTTLARLAAESHNAPLVNSDKSRSS
ncbi:hypothetical protein ACJMK2_009024 [Sinanodonta woodiana]|uniref:NAD(+) ADP-ribosyltransferase n=1 Tax=Sinanodonta woodiana TaxID=1069815 RepID=A0ABD3VAZ3_SINWO